MMLTVRKLSKILKSILDFFATPQICGIPGIQSRFEKHVWRLSSDQKW